MPTYYAPTVAHTSAKRLAMLLKSSRLRPSRPYIRSIPRPAAYYSRRIDVRLFCGGPVSFSQRHVDNLRRRVSTLVPGSSVQGMGTGDRVGQWATGNRLISTDTTAQDRRKDEIYAVIDKANEIEADMARLMDELNLLNEHQGALNMDGPDPEDVFSRVIGHRSEQALEAKVQMTRMEFGDYVPEGYMSDAELQLYIRLYGEPMAREEVDEAEEDEGDGRLDPDTLYRQNSKGVWEEVEYEPNELNKEAPIVYDMEASPPAEESLMIKRTREVADELEADLMMEQSMADADEQSFMRTHPRTQEARAHRDAITIPHDIVSGPISAILSKYPKTHINKAAREIFGGKDLPHSTSTLPPSVQIEQRPISLRASQRHMTEMEGNAFIAVLYPGIYATASSILTEVRKRLGISWIRKLISKEGGPHVLDVGGGGASVLAWREIIRTEWRRMSPGHPDTAPIPMGRSTVVIGSDALQSRASTILDNTTFLPRLPDYTHIRDSPTLDDERNPLKRKQYDIIIASHNLLGIEADFLRKEHVQKLWSLLNPDGGVLVIFEKGRQRGFEAVAGAREMILKRYIASASSTQVESAAESAVAEHNDEKEPGMIIAPCTNHGQCPMYRIPGRMQGRRDYCHFRQRYYRPEFLQRIKGALRRNYEDVEFSYIAVQRGIDLREKHGILQGQEATDAAFSGYEHITYPAWTGEETGAASEGSADKKMEFHTLSLPRIIYPPLKRKGHVTIDLCTPAGEVERWTVPRSYSRQAYRDARKSQWGDLWALGAKTRVMRNLKTGTEDGEGKKERLAKRAAIKAARAVMNEGRELDKEDRDDNANRAARDPRTPKEEEQDVPRWKKRMNKRRARVRARSAERAATKNVASA